jgi:putative effector of murein hydrolase
VNEHRRLHCATFNVESGEDAKMGWQKKITTVVVVLQGVAGSVHEIYASIVLERVVGEPT